MRVRVGARTDIGRSRDHNEDGYLVREPLFAVADGMGGHRGGEVASSVALESLAQLPKESDGLLRALVDRIREANRMVLERGESDPELRGMGTTLTALVTQEQKAHVAHVGDSRAYLLRDGSLQQLTEDHSLVQRMVREGKLTPEQAGRHPQRSILTRALGVDAEVAVDELTLPLLAGDRLLLCTDGLTGMIDPDRIHEILESERDPQAASDLLVEEANGAGGDDNITVVVVDFEDAPGGAGGDGAVAASTQRQSMAPGDPVGAKGAGAPSAEVTGVISAASTEEGAEAEPAPRRRRWWRLVLWAAVVALLIAGGLFAGRAYIRSQWYVGVAEGQVAIYRGIPTDAFGYELSGVEESTDLPAAEVLRLQPWQGLEEGITANGLADARQVVQQIRLDLEEAP
ncbi:MAG: Stp1/IreP family PP2C-type Ser/Thr phosphatase [Actinobacteria bacterium]|nr:Stp1/IreP family PP2C-type Ser/Thr phosphatase [Actinomycetota bacterium]